MFKSVAPSLGEVSPLGAPSPVKRNVAYSTNEGKKWEARWAHPIPHDNTYYAKCMLAGVLSCGLTHTAITPLDVVKCNMQVGPSVESAWRAVRLSSNNVRIPNTTR